jgi:hypothetical protein
LCLVSASCKRPLDEPGYDLSDLPSTKANRLLYNELMNRKAATLHRPDIQELIQRSIVCIEWAKFGGGGRCDQRLIDDVEARTNFLHSCLVACREVREGENLSMFYDTMHDDLVLLEKTIGGVWARPRKAGEEWRYVPQSVQGALRNEPETLDGLEEFLVTTDLLYAIVSSTGLSNLLLFGNKFPLERKGYLEDRLMMEYTCFKYFGDNADIYGDDGQLLDSNDAKKILKWRLDDQTLEKRLAIICDFVGSSFKDLAKHGMLELELTSWSDKPFEVDVDKEPKPLTFEEKDHLSQHAITLKICLREIINNNGFLKKIKVDSHDTMGPSGPILEFSAVGSKDKQATFPPKEHLAWQNAGNFKDRLGVSYRHRGYRFPDEVNHRGKVFDVLREELKHAIQCWNWLWSQHKDAICEHLYSVIGYAYVSSDEEDKEEVDSGGERPLDEATLDDATPADNDSINIALPSVGNSFTDQKEMRLELTTPPTVEVTYESGIVKEFTVEPQLDENKDIVDVPSTARKKKSYRAHIEIPESQLESQLDGASRVCPETKETWWVDMPPHFIFGETPSMAKAESDHMEEDLEKGLCFLSSC